VKKCWRSSRGCSSVTTKHIERIGRGIKRTDEALDGSIFYYGNNFCSKKEFADLIFTTESSIT